MKYFLSIALLFVLISCGEEKTKEEIQERKEAISKLDLEVPEVESIFEKHGFDGSFVLYDPVENEKKYYNKDRCRERFSPASTFKIANSLIALETGVASGKDHKIKWDGKERHYDSWNQDHDLQSAFSNSVVWYYQELARRIGKERMQEYIEKFDYGNENISGDIDKFWLDGALKISQEEQIDFLAKLYNNELPLSDENMNKVKEIMAAEENPEYLIRAKTGASDKTGWYVGWVEKDNKAFFFATNIERKEPFEKFMEARISITQDLLDHYKIIEKK